MGICASSSSGWTTAASPRSSSTSSQTRYYHIYQVGVHTGAPNQTNPTRTTDGRKWPLLDAPPPAAHSSLLLQYVPGSSASERAPLCTGICHVRFMSSGKQYAGCRRFPFGTTVRTGVLLYNDRTFFRSYCIPLLPSYVIPNPTYNTYFIYVCLAEKVTRQ